MKLPILAFILSALLTTFLTPLVKRLAQKYGAVAIPRERDIHKEPMPRWGGISMFAAFMITLLVAYVGLTYFAPHFHWNGHSLNQFIGVLIGATIVAIVGAVDDKIELSAILQTLALVASAVVLILFGVRIEGVTNPFSTGLTPATHYMPHNWIAFSPWVSWLVTVLWVFLVAKTVDFMDGLDGLAAGICAISGITVALMADQAGQYGVSIIAAALAGCCTGFLRDNYNPASIIMGTVGAQFLGFVLAAIAIVGTFKIAATVSVALPILVLGVPIFDGLRVVLTRTIERRPAYLPDRSTHLHHILINRGLSTKQAVSVIWGLVAALCAVALILVHYSGIK